MGKKYFSGLNYTLGNEDTTVEIEIIKSGEFKNIFSICGSGGRSLPLIVKGQHSLTVADLSKEQLMLAELRLQTYKELSFDDFLKFWGYYPYRDNDNCEFRKTSFYKLNLDIETRNFFETVFISLSFSSVLYLGKWERTFNTLAKINRVILGDNFDKIMRFDNLENQISYYQSQFPLLKWKSVIFMLGNKSMFNALLYKGDFIEKNSPLSHFDYYFKAFNRLFTNDIAKKSFFLHLCFYGKINSIEGNPVEASQEIHEMIKKSKASVEYVKEDFVSFLSRGDKKYDFLSLSDVPSYFKGDIERDFLQKIIPALNRGALVVVRYYLRTSHVDLKGFKDVTSEYQEIISAEKVQMYNIKVYAFLGTNS